MILSLYPQNVVFEGTTDDSLEPLFLVIDPTEDRTINLTDVSNTRSFLNHQPPLFSNSRNVLIYLCPVLGTASANDSPSVDSNRNISGLHMI